MKKLWWKIRYAKHLKRRLGISFFDAMKSAESGLENIDNDITECPIYSADEEYYAWADAARDS